MSIPLVSGFLCLGIISRTLLGEAEREGEENIAFLGPILRPTLKIWCLRILQKEWLEVAQSGSKWLLLSPKRAITYDIQHYKTMTSEGYYLGLFSWLILMGLCWDHMIINSGFQHQTDLKDDEKASSSKICS